MDRRDILLEGVKQDMLGIEIGPYHQPLVPKREDYCSMSLDVFDADTLRENAAEFRVEIAAIKLSKGWRLTAPLRGGVMLRRLVRSFADA